MASSTALQLVNRVLVRIGENKVNDSTTFSSAAGEDALEFVNEAKEQILETRVWPFDRRRDYLETKPVVTLTTWSLTNGTAVVGASGVAADSIADADDTFLGRVHPSEDANYGNTSFPLAFYTQPAAALIGTLDQSYPGTTVSGSGTATFFVAEYQIPSHSTSATNSADDGEKYRQILSVKHQEKDLKLVFVDGDEDLDLWVPRLHENINNDPRVIFVGGTVEGSGTTERGSPRTGFTVWPVPETAQRLDYVGVYRHPELATPEDTLDNVEAPVENLIVSLAAAKWFQGPGRDARTGVVLEQATLKYVEHVYRGMRRQPPERNPLLSLDSRNPNSTFDFGRIPSQLDGT